MVRGWWCRCREPPLPPLSGEGAWAGPRLVGVAWGRGDGTPAWGSSGGVGVMAWLDMSGKEGVVFPPGVESEACWGPDQKGGSLAPPFTLPVEGDFRPRFNRERRRSMWLFSIWDDKNGRERPESEFGDSYPSGREWEEMAGIFRGHWELWSPC